jgi:pimeloyl-ACP methyl ester carboxylesterase
VPYAEVNGQRLLYEDSGGDASVVAFSHGFLMDHSMFDPQVEALRQALASGLPDAELVLIEGAGHASNLTHPQLVNPHVERFLSERL